MIRYSIHVPSYLLLWLFRRLAYELEVCTTILIIVPSKKVLGAMQAITALGAFCIDLHNLI